MRKVTGPMRAAPQFPRAATRHVGPSSTVEGGPWVIVLSILFWLIFYQNLPWSLDGFSVAGGPVADATSGNTQDRIVKVLMLVLSLYVIATRWSLTRSLAKYLNGGTVAFLALAVLSAVWSADSTATLLRFTSLITIVLVCFAISLAGWHRQRLQQLTIPPLMFILIVSLLAGMIFPERIAEVGTDISQKDAWHGITHGKNEFGMFSSMAVIICSNSWLSRGRRSYWAIAGTALAFLCLILSRSNTSLLATLVSVLTMVLVMRVPVIRRRFSTLVAVTLTTIILLYEMVIQNVLPGVNTLLSPIRSLTGKDNTFSARTIIWNLVKEHIQYSPYLGTGYGAYWLGSHAASPSYIFVLVMHFYPTEAHNGYLDIVNDLGYVGLTCLLVFLFWFIRQALQLMPFDRSQSALYLALLFQEMVINMSESDFFSRTSTFAILLLASMCLSRALLEARRSAQPLSSG